VLKTVWNLYFCCKLTGFFCRQLNQCVGQNRHFRKKRCLVRILTQYFQINFSKYLRTVLLKSQLILLCLPHSCCEYSPTNQLSISTVIFCATLSLHRSDVLLHQNLKKKRYLSRIQIEPSS